MYIRRTLTCRRTTGESYFTYRLVRSERIGAKVRQVTLLNLGSLFGLAEAHWPELCRRIEEIVSARVSLLGLSGEREAIRRWRASRGQSPLVMLKWIRSRDRLRGRIGRLKERHAIGQHYRIDVQTDDDQQKAIRLSWQRGRAGTRLTDPGVYCLRTNVLEWDEEKLWHTYTTNVRKSTRAEPNSLGLSPSPGGIRKFVS
jgi:hypothetical protein